MGTKNISGYSFHTENITDIFYNGIWKYVLKVSLIIFLCKDFDYDTFQYTQITDYTFLTESITGDIYFTNDMSNIILYTSLIDNTFIYFFLWEISLNGKNDQCLFAYYMALAEILFVYSLITIFIDDIFYRWKLSQTMLVYSVITFIFKINYLKF